MWMGLSGSLGHTSQIFAPGDADLTAILRSSEDFDAVVVVPDSPAHAASVLEILHGAGLHRRCILVSDATDLSSMGRALVKGIGGWVVTGSTPEKLARSVDQVVEGGMSFDAPFAAALHETLVLGDPAKSAGMSAARALVSALELKDTYTGGHAERVTALAMRLADEAGMEDAPPSSALEVAFLLHDVGKIGIPESILTKPAGLTEIERKVLETHPILGERIVAPLNFPACVREVVRHHHERWDGTGYPDGLSGYAIPVAARIFTIADVLDAMTSVRPYRRPVTFRDAMDHILSMAGTHFDPALCAVAAEVFLGEAADFDASVLFDT